MTYNVREVADKLDVSEQTVRIWIRKGYLRAKKLSNRTGFVITTEAIYDFCRKSKYGAAGFVILDMQNPKDLDTEPMLDAIQEKRERLKKSLKKLDAMENFIKGSDYDVLPVNRTLKN